MPRRVERLAADALVSPVRITAGEAGAANEDVKQARSSCGWKERPCFDLLLFTVHTTAAEAVTQVLERSWALVLWERMSVLWWK